MAWCTLTTTDNPYHPLDDFDNWRDFDEQHSYHTLSYLARLTNFSEKLSDKDAEEEQEFAVNECLRLNLIGLATNGKVNYKKVYETK